MQDCNKVLITGTAGFIGFHLVTSLLKKGFEVIGIDSVNDYYEVSLKVARLREHGIEIDLNTVSVFHKTVTPGKPKRYLSSSNSNYTFYLGYIDVSEQLNYVFKQEKPHVVINLAAQPGVRYSLANPSAYISANIDGFLNILEACRLNKIVHLIYASSSSVYGLNRHLPFHVDSDSEHPISLYGVTKKTNELMAHCYAHLYNLPVTGLRFFTVYGPWGRPDMALYNFTGSIIKGKPINLYNGGNMIRDFTYVEDIVESIYRLIYKSPTGKEDEKELERPSTSIAPYKIYNIGNNSPVILKDFLQILENEIGKRAIINDLQIQPGDVYATHADISELIKVTGYTPSTSVSEGIKQFVSWYRSYYQI